MRASREPHKESNKPHNTDRPQFQRSNPIMTKKESKQIIMLLKSINNIMSAYTEFSLGYEEKEIMKGKFEIEVECMFQNRAALLLLLLNEFSIVGIRVEDTKLLII